ncbi:MAG TPA: response regulator [Burkholderiaceae bacterium]
MSDPDNVAVPVILFVDDEATAVKYFQRAIGPLAPVATASSVEEGKQVLSANAATIKVLVSDQRMPGAYGNELLEFAKDNFPDVVRILTTAYSEIEHMVEAVNQGQIYRYIQKPWEITALRMEMKQALDMANLRGEHTQLLREKIMVQRQQLFANRIGNAYSLCLAAGQGSALESYLRAIDAVGIVMPELDWMKMDYADVVGAEAFRLGAFQALVIQALAAIEAGASEDKLSVVAHALGDKVTLVQGGLLLQDAPAIAEYFQGASGEPVSTQHAAWLAALLWLDRKGASLRFSRDGSGWRCALDATADPMTEARLAAWIGHFMP